MDIVKDIFLEDQPAKDDEALLVLNLYSEENILGEEDYLKKVKEAEISVGKVHISFLPDENNTFPGAILTPDRSKWDLYLVHIPFTIHETPTGSHYEKVKFMVSLEEYATAFDLLPKNVYMEENIEKKYALSPELKFLEFGMKVGEIKYEISFERLKPIIKVFGVGENEFYWIYKNLNNQEDFSGQKHALIVLEVPTNTKSVSGNIFCEAIIEKKILGIWTPKPAKVLEHSHIKLTLP